MMNDYPLSYQIKSFLKNESVNTEVIKEIFVLVADKKSYIDIEDFKIFIHHLIKDCQLQSLANDDDEKAYVRKNMMRTQVKEEEFRTFIIDMLSSETKPKEGNKS
jgi:hypothetical protein